MNSLAERAVEKTVKRGSVFPDVLCVHGWGKWPLSRRRQNITTCPPYAMQFGASFYRDVAAYSLCGKRGNGGRGGWGAEKKVKTNPAADVHSFAHPHISANQSQNGSLLMYFQSDSPANLGVQHMRRNPVRTSVAYRPRRETAQASHHRSVPLTNMEPGS